jgi:ABC-type branched-subunit amino acid transport system substrate-binding protein
MAAATSSITEASPFIIRTSFTLPQASVSMADWAPNHGIKKVVTLVSDYGPGMDAENDILALADSRNVRQRCDGGESIDLCMDD